ncbi:MAG TPA: TIGR03668 family PPOX class F420-dependent oxidoreductase [Acidimicrobiales bacterium]|nr:TIGR03668 family PPOX class F420-dependent oxidoreductase [Acidimicrobiales bacterium]
MDAATARARLASASVGHLATVTAQGAPHVVPCCFALDGEVIVTAVDAKAKSTLRLRRLDNVRRHPTAALLVDHYEDDWDRLWWVRVEGPAQVREAGPERRAALEALAAKYPQYRRQEPPGPVIALAVSRWRWWP